MRGPITTLILILFLLATASEAASLSSSFRVSATVVYSGGVRASVPLPQNSDPSAGHVQVQVMTLGTPVMVHLKDVSGSRTKTVLMAPTSKATYQSVPLNPESGGSSNHPLTMTVNY